VKQPALGVLSSALVIGISLAFISIFALPVFITWVAFLMICLIPMLIVISVTWGGKNPVFAARLPQPGRGLLFLLVAAAAGAVVAVVHFFTVGGSIRPPAPMLSMCIVTTVIITFWFAVILGGWPFSGTTRRPVFMGLLMLVAAYVVNYLLFRLFFDFTFMKDAPIYSRALDPRGLFNAWNAQVAYVTAISAMFLMLCFELWPLAKVPALMRQPLLGLVWTALVLVIGAAALLIGVGLLRTEAPVFMIQAPIPFVFGTIVVLNMLQGSLFKKLAQPLKGILNAAAAALIGVGLSRLFGVLAPAISGRMASGPPDYVFEIWTASALLAVTFPFLIIFAELFQFWPLANTKTGGKRG
jgi:hypothetical protein